MLQFRNFMSQQLKLLTVSHIQIYMRWNRSHNWAKLIQLALLKKTTRCRRRRRRRQQWWWLCIHKPVCCTEITFPFLNLLYDFNKRPFECQSWRSALVFNTLHSHQVHHYNRCSTFVTCIGIESTLRILHSSAIRIDEVHNNSTTFKWWYTTQTKEEDKNSAMNIKTTQVLQ